MGKWFETIIDRRFLSTSTSFFLKDGIFLDSVTNHFLEGVDISQINYSTSVANCEVSFRSISLQRVGLLFILDYVSTNMILRPLCRSSTLILGDWYNCADQSKRTQSAWDSKRYWIEYDSIQAMLNPGRYLPKWQSILIDLFIV